MATIHQGRFSADDAKVGTVLFLIGMRVNRLWQIWKWWPVFVAMPRMLAELRRHPELGLVGRPRTFVSGRVVLVWQYWASFDQLEAYARASDHVHLPAWRAFHRRVRANGAVGIFHETVLLANDTVETIYVNMPSFGLGAVSGLVATKARGQSAGERLGRSPGEVPPVDPS